MGQGLRGADTVPGLGLKGLGFGGLGGLGFRGLGV